MPRAKPAPFLLSTKDVTRPRLPSSRQTFGPLIVTIAALTSCDRPAPSDSQNPPPPAGIIAQVGSVSILESDLKYRLKEHYSGRSDEGTRQAAIDDLVKRAQFSQAAIDEGLINDPLVRDEVSRLLQARLRELTLQPEITQRSEISEERLRELYQENLGQFQAPEKRQIAVLWLNPGVDPDKATRYQQKLRDARQFLLDSEDLTSHPEKGFSALSVDHSEHHASRYRGGVIGWLESGGGMDKWTKAVARIAFSIKETGGMSEVVLSPEGVFLVRLMNLQPAITRPFESVRGELQRTELKRQRQQVESGLEAGIAERYPVQWPEDTLPP